MKLLKSLQEAIEETTSINNVDDQVFDKDAHGEAPVAYSDAVISMQKKHKEIRKQLKDHQDAAEKELKISDADRINVETPKNDNLKKMHLSESLFEDFEEDGWPEELAEYEVLRKLDDLIYELRSSVRGANSGAKTFDELADYLDILADNLSDMAHDIRNEYSEGESLEEKKTEFLGEGLDRTFVELPSFKTSWKNLGLTDDDLRELQNLILTNPSLGIPLGSNVYKIRFSPESLNRGKDTSNRVIYIGVVKDSQIYLVIAFSKSDESNITKEELERIREISKEL